VNKKGFALLVICVMIGGLIITGCASAPAAGLLGGFSPALSNVNGESTKFGEASSTVWFGVFGEYTYPPIQKAAQAGGITKIATVEYYSKPGFLGLSTEFFTIVSGE